MDEGATPPRRRRLGRWRRRAAAWSPERTQDAQFARDRTFLDEDAVPIFRDDLFRSRARFLIGMATLAGAGITVIVWTFRLFPPVVGVLLTLSAAALVVGWRRAHRAETPWHLARHRARP